MTFVYIMVGQTFVSVVFTESILESEELPKFLICLIFLSGNTFWFELDFCHDKFRLYNKLILIDQLFLETQSVLNCFCSCAEDM